MDGSFVGQIASYPFDPVSVARTQDWVRGYRPVVRDAKPRCGSGAFAGADFRPANAIRRQTAAWDGLCVESVRVMQHDLFEVTYCGPRHLLIAYEQGVRRDGESSVDDLARSTRHDLSCKLTYVPAGQSFREWHVPRVLTQATYFYVDSQLMNSDDRASAGDEAPRLFFDSPVLWQTTQKLKRLIEIAPSPSRTYAEALGVVLAHELLSLDGRTPAVDAPARGGLAGWQRKGVARYIEDNLAEQIPLAKLAELARLSVYHFSRAFAQSFGMPPHRYHTSRRIERAKELLANPRLPVTEIAAEVGFVETSSFSAAFRRLTGGTPTAYRRGLG